MKAFAQHAALCTVLQTLGLCRVKHGMFKVCAAHSMKMPRSSPRKRNACSQWQQRTCTAANKRG